MWRWRLVIGEVVERFGKVGRMDGGTAGSSAMRV